MIALRCNFHEGRPNIRFDATVAIKIVPGKSPTVVVADLAN
jgi:hypothetical protein